MAKFRCKNCDTEHDEEVSQCRLCGMQEFQEQGSASELLDEMDRVFG